MERPKFSGSRPSAIPRLSRLPDTNPSLRSTVSKDITLPNKIGSSSLIVPRLRQSASRDNLYVSSSNRASLTPRSSSTNLQSGKVSAQPTIYSFNPGGNNSQDDRVSKPQQLSSHSEDETENSIFLTTKDESARHGSFQNGRSTLSERAIETLRKIPSSPALRNKESKFFNNDPNLCSNPGPNLGPASVSNSNLIPVPEGNRSFANNSPKTLKTGQYFTPTKSSSKVRALNNQSSLRSIESNSHVYEVSTTKVIQSPVKSMKLRNKNSNPRPTELRNSVKSVSKILPASTLQQSQEVNSIITVRKKSSMLSINPQDENVNSRISTSSRAVSTSYMSKNEETKYQKSSLALRDQIAKAKASKRAASLQTSAHIVKDDPVTPSDSLDFALSSHTSQNVDQNDNKDLLKKRISFAQKCGKLNISAMGLKEISYEVVNMCNLQFLDEISWGEVVDLVKLIAADNEIEEISNDIFPDINPDDVTDHDNFKIGQFYYLETLDIRGNRLKNLPLGLRRLECLTVLNLSGNQLTNECLHVISQIHSLRDLSLGHNKLSGRLDIDFWKMKNLVTLNIRQNDLSELPESLVDLTNLQLLNISENQFKSLPINSLSKLALTELIAYKNKLSDTLIPEGIDILPYLQILDVTRNSLTSLSSSDIRLPKLQKLLCASNRLKNLPSLTSWSSLLTINAENNLIETLPLGLVELPKIKSINFHGNQIQMLNKELGKMESLEILHITGNPLREKKFASMSTGDLKFTLLKRLESEIEDGEINHLDQPILEAHESFFSKSQNSPTWVLKFPGVLDRSKTQSHSLNPVIAAEIAAKHQIKILQLHNNNFRVIPESTAFFAATLTNLNISHNELSSDTYLNDSLELPELIELNLSANTLDSLQPLLQHLKAPKLERLDVSFNRLSSLPVLRKKFPKLTTLLTSHNTIKELLPESIKDMHVVDCSSNDLSSLNPKIGLLDYPKGLKQLDVRNNRFKVPNYSLLEKGTETVLVWLRSRIPAGEKTSSDGEESF